MPNYHEEIESLKKDAEHNNAFNAETIKLLEEKQRLAKILDPIKERVIIGGYESISKEETELANVASERYFELEEIIKQRSIQADENFQRFSEKSAKLSKAIKNDTLETQAINNLAKIYELLVEKEKSIKEEIDATKEFREIAATMMETAKKKEEAGLDITEDMKMIEKAQDCIKRSVDRTEKLVESYRKQSRAYTQALEAQLSKTPSSKVRIDRVEIARAEAVKTKDVHHSMTHVESKPSSKVKDMAKMFEAQPQSTIEHKRRK